MRFDLQDIRRDHPRAFVATAATVVVAFAVLAILGLSRGHRARPTGHGAAAVIAPPSNTATRSTSTSASASPTSATSSVTTPPPGYHPAYASDVPASEVDQAVASEMGASGTTAAEIEAVTPAAPGWTPDYPAVPSADTHDDQSYATALLQELLDRDYRHQSRSDLAQWVSAESADEMLPGSTTTVGDRVAWVELMDPAAVGEQSGLVPTASQWTTDARTGVRQRVYDIFVDTDPRWAKAVGAGLSTEDPLLTVDDVTGVIATTTGARTSTQHFSLELMVGSALHHPGYGVASLDEWETN
jgi:hypothetical protein